ncbi:MAG: hypothetical protein J1E62_02365 [Lachnospiraceae bacterium]|nr:hypothetical protein [Lachnospiraceae bacterium]
MNNYKSEARNRGQNLLIVEGKHEKDKLFWLLFQCFPEINISIDDIWVYGTNIYMLYEDIVKEYGPEWVKDDIDLPFVISKKQNMSTLRYKEDFTNIIIVFDYERHDTNFSETKILEMQKYFVDVADMGKLYINYPMLESYQHLRALPDNDYAERKIPVSLKPGKKYKSLVAKETVIEKSVEFPHRIDDLLNQHLGISDEHARKTLCNAILSLSNDCSIDDDIHNILEDAVGAETLLTIKNQLKDWLVKLGYIHNSQTYWEYMRILFCQIIKHNIFKAKRIQNNQFQIEDEKYKVCFEELDLVEILTKQNLLSRDAVSGYIWVLNTSIFFVADYNFSLITSQD